MKLLLEKLLDILEAVLRFRHRRSSKTEKISVRVKNDPEKRRKTKRAART